MRQYTRVQAAVHKGLIVTTQGFTREAKEFAAKANIELLTFHDLSTQLVNFDDYIDRLTQEFEQSPVFPYYIIIDLSGTLVEEYEGADESVFQRPLIDSWNQEAGGSPLSFRRIAP